MRKIEQQMISAIKSRRDWRNDNTEVLYSPSRKVSCVYLHKNLIATISKDEVEIYDGGWQSNTTKSRLNAIINGLCDGYNQGVYQKQRVWYIRDDEDGADFTIPFQHGYTFKRIK
jgi:hypothetical protein